MLALLVPLSFLLCGCGDDGGAVDAGSDAGSLDAPMPADAWVQDSSTAPVDPLTLADEVSLDEISRTITDLQNMGTRHTNTPGNAVARTYLTTRLEEYGLVVEEDPFTADSEPTANLIARKAGVLEPEVVWILSAHYDSTSDRPYSDAPGADDNASAVAALLEAARILQPLRFRYSLWFVLTGAEEQGSLGSAHLARWLVDEPVEVRGINAPDMIGYWPLGSEDLFDILGDPASAHLVTQMASIADALGVAHKTFVEHSYCYGDDHTMYQEAGLPAITTMDCVEGHNLSASTGESTPHYHDASDTIDTLHLPFTTRVVGVMVAHFATWGEPVL